MKIRVAACFLSAQCLLQGSEAFLSQATRHAGVRKQEWQSSSIRQRQDTSLHVSSIGDKLMKRIGQEIDPADTDGSAFLKQLKRPMTLSDREMGLLVLLTVPVAWGTYSCTVQSLYTLEPAVPGFIFSTCYFCVAAAASLCVTFAQSSKAEPTAAKTIPVRAGLELGLYVYLANFLHVIGLQSVPSDRAGFLIQMTTVMVPLLEAFFARDLLAIPASTWGACGLALAGILVMGMEFPFGAQEQMEIMAASSTETLDQAAAFVSNNAGSTFDTAAVMESTLTLDPSAVVVESVQSVMEASSSFSWEFLLQGDTLIVGAAALYAMQILRISRWTAEYTPLQIMTGKTMGEAFFSLLFLGSTVGLTNSGIVDSTNTNPALSFLQTSGNQAIEFYTTVTARLSEGSMSLDTIEHFVGATLWTGLVSTCYVVFAQSYGQKLVKASDANLIYSLQPLFTAIFAYWMLGETLQPMGFFGGALIGAGVYTVATKSLAATEKA